MAIDERSRHELSQRLEAVLGTAEADTMMELLPPVGWADVATKHDLALTSEALRTEMAAIRGEIRSSANELRAEFSSQHRQLVLTLVPLMVAINGIGVTLAAILG